MSTMQKRNRQRGKDYERFIAKFFKGKRIGVLGGEDVEHKELSIECKTVAKFRGVAFMEQAETHCPTDKIPVVAVRVSGSSHSKDMIIIKLDDFIHLIERGESDEVS